jgi:hypothetical protein
MDEGTYMNIAFISNHIKTIFFHGIARKLESIGFNVFWISPSRLASEWLAANGVASGRQLDLSTFGPEWTNGKPLLSDEVREIAKQEVDGGWNVNNIILMDRLLSRKPYDYALKHISVILREIPRFLADNRIEYLCSEHVWTLELLTTHICDQLGVMNVEPMGSRIPGESFCFYKGNLQDQVVPIREVTNEDRERAAEFHDEYLLRKPRPYGYSLLHTPRPELNWLPKLFANLMREIQDPYDETRRPFRQVISYRSSEALMARTALRSKYFSFPDPEPKRPYVLFPLQVQPESSIDVLGALFSNQIELVKTLSRTLPSTHDLYVKEHPGGLGNRSAHDYNKLRQLPGVRLVHPHADTFSIISKADLVVGISNTVMYEAALLGKPAVSIAPMYFGDLLLCNGFNPYEGSLARMLELARKSYAGPGCKEERRAKNIEFLAWLSAQSFPGNINDPRSDPSCIEQANLDNVADGFVQLLRRRKAILNRTDQSLHIAKGTESRTHN